MPGLRFSKNEYVEFKAKLIDQYGLFCYYCTERKRYKDLTLDHIYPYSHGGRNKIGNLVLACFPCNKKKGHRIISIDEFRAEVLGIPIIEATQLDLQQRRIYKAINVKGPVRQKIQGPSEVKIIQKVEEIVRDTPKLSLWDKFKLFLRLTKK